MTEDHNSTPDSRENPQKELTEIYLDFPDAERDAYKEQPQRRYVDKIVRGIQIGRGENKQVIELEQVRRLAMLHCSYADMAKFFGVKENTFINNFRYEVERAREVTKHRLMEAMLENAIQKHNPAIQIFLAKNWLGLVNDPVAQEGVTPLPWLDEE
tara:strand:+ start:428 stop:895 length:468 start_codon:yes stop_codon:yes gene_type:complete